MQVAAELFPILEPFKRNPEQTMLKLKESGFEGIELYGDPILEPEKLKKLITKSGLKITGYQVPWRLMQNGGMEKVIGYQKKLENTHIIIAALGGPWESGHKISENTIATWEKHAERINEMDKLLSENNMDLTYHTHSYDFGDKVEQKETSFEIFKRTVSSSVNFEIDSGNCIEGGLSPQKEIIKIRGRVPFVHCKPYATSKGYEIKFGTSLDENNWPEILDSAKKAETKWMVIEPEAATLGDSMDLMVDGLNCIKKYL